MIDAILGSAYADCSGLPCCTRPASHPVKDVTGRYLGLENGRSCNHETR